MKSLFSLTMSKFKILTLLPVLMVFTGSALPVFAVQVPYREVSALAWSHDSTWLAIGYIDGTVEIRNLNTQETLLNTDATTSVVDLDWHPSDSSKLVIGFDIGILWLWDLNTGDILKLPLETDNLTSIDWSPDGTRIVSAENTSPEHYYNAVAIRDASTLALLEEYIADTELIFEVKWSPVEGDERIISTSIDGKTIIWDATNGAVIYRVFSPLGGYDVAWSPTGEQFVTISGDDVLRVWDAVNYSAGNFFWADYHAAVFLMDVAWSPIKVFPYGSQVAVIDGEAIVIYGLYPCQPHTGKTELCGKVFNVINTESVMNVIAWSSDGQLAYGGGGRTGVTIRQAPLEANAERAPTFIITNTPDIIPTPTAS